MSRSSKKQRTKLCNPGIPGPRIKAYQNLPLAAATKEDRETWNGFCEIESEPAFFNAMLKQFGVKGVKVQEIVSLEEDFLSNLPQPVYGLIFLFRYKEDDPVKQESSCPSHVWFANQTINNACASVALLNIVNNRPEIDLGEHLSQFKSFTKDLTPALRGDAISNFRFIKDVHNSFARKMDMLNADLYLKNEAKCKKVKSKQGKAGDNEDESGFHFIAFVPIQGKVWKLDGLERQPQILGDIGDYDWLLLAKPDIETRMADYESDQIEFAILSLVRDPLLKLIRDLAQSVKILNLAMSRLLELGEPFEVDTAKCMIGPEPKYRLTCDLIESQDIPESVHAILVGYNKVELHDLHEKLISTQENLRTSIQEELDSARTDEERTARRCYDHGSLIQKWIGFLAHHDAIKPIAEAL